MRRILLALLIVAPIAGCVSANDIAKQVGQPPKQAAELRSLQVRRFDTVKEVSVLTAATETLQDLGFTVSEATADVGVLVGSKQRDAVESGQVAGQVALTVLLAVMGSVHVPTYDQNQTITVNVVVTPVQNSEQTDVRVSFDRQLVNNHGQLWRAELILEPKIYQEFFDKLAASMFLEAHTI